MGVFYETIPDTLVDWIRDQKVFWVATAPLSGSGHVNVSPKGGKYFGVIDGKTFWYHDLSGSGSETIAHLHEPKNGRITIMFNAFEGAPKIVRLWGKGRVLEFGTKEFTDFVDKQSVELMPGTRSIIVVDIHQVGSSCGFSVPFYEFKDFRPVLNNHFEKKQKRYLAGKEDESMDHYWALKSAWSVDGLPAMKRGLASAKTLHIAPLKKMVGPLAPKSYQCGQGFDVLQVLLVALLSFLIGLAVSNYGKTAANIVAETMKGSPLEVSFGNATQTLSLGSLGMGTR